MNKLGLFFAGALSVVALILLGGAALLLGARGFSAREQPSALERWMAHYSRSLAWPGDARQRTNPIPATPEVLAEARAHWADHCATCHANDGSGDVEMGKRMYPPAPDMRQRETQQLTDGELFFIIQNGIRLTGMPAWGGDSGHGEQDSWKLVRFIRHLPDLTLEERKEMEKLNPKGPEDRKEEEEEEKFLKGDTTDESQEHHHH